MDYRYLNWMISKVRNGEQFRLLFEDLMNIEFYYVVSMDENRKQDGLYFRYEYGVQTGAPNFYEDYPMPCSFLEVLFGLAKHLTETFEDSRFPRDFSRWVMILLGNCGLDEYDNEGYDNRKGWANIRRKTQIIMDRRYHASGLGGFFPLRGYTGDARLVELWVQMDLFVQEMIEFE